MQKEGKLKAQPRPRSVDPERNEWLRMEKCGYCGGKLDWVALPNVVYADGRPSEEISAVRICSKCGQYHEDEATKRIPTLDEVRGKK